MLRGGTELTLSDSFPGDIPPWQEVTVALLGSRPRSSPPLGIFLVSFQVVEVRKGRGGRRGGTGGASLAGLRQPGHACPQGRHAGLVQKMVYICFAPSESEGKKTQRFFQEAKCVKN